MLIPAFAVDRTEIVLQALHRLRDAGRIPDVPVFVDSPMALAALQIYVDALPARAGPAHRPAARPFGLAWCGSPSTVDESIALNHPERPSIIVSASGMASGGRVVHHLAALAGDSRNTVLLVGFQAPGTRGADLAAGVRQLKALGRYVPVHCAVEVFHGLSVHADGDELVAWLAAGPEVPAPEACYVVHGEPASARALAERLHAELGWPAIVPDDGEIVRLG